MLALHCDSQLLGECVLEEARRRHAQTLVSEAQSLLKQCDVAPSDVDLIAVSQGPGSFTGLRVGVVFAKTFAFVVSAKLVAVDTLQSVALAADESVHHMHVVSDAQREQLFVGEYDRVSQDEWTRRGEIQIRDNEEWIGHIAKLASDGFAVAGPGLVKITDELPQNVGVLPETDWNPRATNVGIIGAQQAARGDYADPFELEPFYLRKSAAEEKRDLQIQNSSDQTKE